MFVGEVAEGAQVKETCLCFTGRLFPGCRGLEAVEFEQLRHLSLGNLSTYRVQTRSTCFSHIMMSHRQRSLSDRNL